MWQLTRLYLFSLFFLLTAFARAQTDGWTSSCSPDNPSVLEVMVDACGADEFRSEYVILRTGNAPFDIRQFNMTVTNPLSTAFIGAVSVQNGNLNAAALQKLNESAQRACAYGTVFRHIFSDPYNGIVPQNATILLFTNKDSTDVSYLSPNSLALLCGSKVFVGFGTIRPQSPGVSIFRNYPQNGFCGTGCYRQIAFSFNGNPAQTCLQLTYDIKKLPNLNTTNPPIGFNEGAYIRPLSNGSLTYGGGNLQGLGVICMPPESMNCVIPPMPDFGNGFWHVLAFDGFNTFDAAHFKGFYQAKPRHTASIGTATADNFEFNTLRDGWGGTQGASEAHTSLGALRTYEGCNVRADSFSILAKRKGFDCGYYTISLINYDDYSRIRIDNNGDGTWDFDRPFNPPACATGCFSEVWQGFLSPESRIEIYGYDIRGSFQIHYLFQKLNTPPSVKITVLSTTATSNCNSTTGALSTAVSGGIAPYSIRWTGVTPIPNGVETAINLASGLYQMRVTDGVGCVDSAQILVPQTNNIAVNAAGDTAFCPNGTAILRGGATGGSGTLRYEWISGTSPTVLATSQNFSPIVSKSTAYILRATDAQGCFKTDTVHVRVYPSPVIHVQVTPNDTICNDAVPTMIATGAQTYTWSSFPAIGAAALDIQNDRARVFALFLPAPYYIFTATGTDANGCRSTGDGIITIIPLPNVSIAPVMDTLCDDAAPYRLTLTPATGGRVTVQTITQTAAIPCPNCVENGLFYPDRAGPGDHLVSHELSNDFGCKNAPSIHIWVKNCSCPTRVVNNIAGTICFGDSLYFDTRFLKTAGIYRDTFRKPDGCDSIVVLDLKIRLPDTTRLSLKTCNPALVGLRIDTLQNRFNCDSLIYITRTFGRLDTTRYTFVICEGDSVRVNNVWIKTVGETRFPLRNIEGCDSIVIANVSFTKKDTSYLNRNTCDPRQVRSDTLRLTNRVGCDSLVITRTRLAPPDSTFITRGSCFARDTGLQTLRLQNREGCDSLVFTRTILKRRDSTRLNRRLCEGDSLFFNNGFIKTRGSFTETRQNTEGCDSVIILSLDFWKKDTTLFQLSSCNPSRVGVNTQKFQNQRGCDSVVISETRLIPTTMQSRLSISKPISCHGSSDGSISIQELTGGTLPYTYLWSNGKTANRLDSLRANLYRLIITDSEGCRLMDSIQLDEPPPLSIEAESLSPKCFGELVGSIQIKSIRGGNAPFKVEFNGKIQTLGILPATWTDIRLGFHDFVLIDQKGCRLDTSLFIPQALERTIDLGNDITIGLGDSTQIGAFLNFRGGRFRWTPKEGILRCDTCVPTMVAPLETTTYKLTAQDSSGCQVSEEITVFVEKRRKVFIPTAFSPNGDGTNDRFVVFGDKEVKQVQRMNIYNRWGNLVFSQTGFPANDETQGWDGKVGSMLIPNEVFTYFALVEFIDGKVSLYSGDVMIVR
jgi:gliding motility-associated-like protein